MKSHTSRLASLDILRGLDLFMLVFLQPVVWELGHALDWPWLNVVLYQLDHEVWEGFRCWDLVMPLFLFMAGVSMPFSFSKYQRERQFAAAYRHVAVRFSVLFLLGMVVQGNLLALDAGRITIYTNTLQAIAVGYAVSAVIILNIRRQSRRIAATAGLLLAYSLPMSLWGDFSCEGNLANVIDEAVLGRFRGDPTYTWVFTSLSFSVTVMLGTFAGYIMKNAGSRQTNAALRMACVGVALVAVAALWSVETPVIKRIWSGSMALLSGGLCFLLMALFYYVVDCKGYSYGLGWLRIYGMNAITAYCVGEIVDFRSIARSLTFGLEPLMGDLYPCWLTFCNYSILLLLLQYMYRHRIFVKI